MFWWIVGSAGVLMIVATLGWLGYRFWWMLEHYLGANRREDLW